MAVRRLTTELDKLATAPIPNVSASMVGEDRFKWTATFLGPEGSPYEGGVFAVSVAFPADYPFKPPKLVFTTKIFHPNVKSDTGDVCMEIFGPWSPAVTMKDMLGKVAALFQEANTESPINAEAAALYTGDKAKFDETAREWTRRFAV